MRSPFAFSKVIFSSFRLPGRLCADSVRLSMLSSSEEAAPSSSDAISWGSLLGETPFALVLPPLLVDFMLKSIVDFMLKSIGNSSIGASCELFRCVGGDVDDANVTFLSRNVDVVTAVEFDRRLALLALRNEVGGCGDVGGVIDTTISSLSISSSSSLLFELLSFGEHCDFRTASKYRFVNSSADLLPIWATHRYRRGKTN